MKIGIIIYSQTGNTLAVAQTLKEKLAAAGHTVNVERVEPVGRVTSQTTNPSFNRKPDTSAYDAIVFGSPVQGFKLARAMEAYLNQLPSLHGKKIACFVTKGLPIQQTGGTQAISQMKSICESKGAKVNRTGIVKCTGMLGKKRISKLVEEISKSF